MVQDYQRGAPALAEFFTGSPRDPIAYERKAAEIANRFAGGRRAAVADAIRATSPGAARRLAEVIRGDGFLVTTGQQPGFLTGPLYTTYKILTAVRLARTLESILERPVAPLFWVASEDHDWAEASRATLVDTANRLRHVDLPGPDGEATVPMRNRVLDERVSAVLDEVASMLPATEFEADLMELLRRCYQPGRSVAGAFEELVAALFAPFDLLIVDAGHPALKAAGREVLARELESAAEHEARIATQTQRLLDAGYHAQVTVSPGATNVFLDDGAGRDRILRDGDAGFRLRRSGRTYTRAELMALLRDSPTSFSANVLLRPVLESAVFPTLAYVAGPGEVSYFAQIGCLFEAHGIAMPIVYPRASMTLIEHKVRKVLDKFGLTLEEVQVTEQELTARVVRGELPEEVTRALESLRSRLHEGYDVLAEASSQVDPTLRGPINAARNASLKNLGTAERKILQAYRKQQEIRLEQLGKVSANLYPEGQFQERVLNVVPYLARYGREMLGTMADNIAIQVDGTAPAWSGVRCTAPTGVAVSGG